MKKLLLIFAMIMALCVVTAACSGSDTGSEAGASASAGSTANATAAAKATPTAAPATATPEPATKTYVSISVDDLIYTSVVSVEYNGNTETWYKELEASQELDVDEMEIALSVPADGSEVEVKAVLQKDAPYKITGWSGDAKSDSEIVKFVPSGARMNLTINVEPLFEENVADGSTVECSVTTEENVGSRWGNALLTDSDLNTRFSTGTLPNVNDETLELDEPVTIDVDMGEAKAFNTILLFPRTDALDIDGGVANFPFEFDIQVSSDGTEYKTVQTVKNEENVNDMVQTYSVGDQNAQYIRLSVKVIGNMAGDEATAATPYRIQFAELMAVNVK